MPPDRVSLPAAGMHALGALLPGQIIAAVLSAYAYIFFEWLFFITKSSPLATMTRPEQIGVLVIAPLPLAALACLATALTSLLALGLRVTLSTPRMAKLGWAPSAFLLAACAFMLIDNFTYTLFEFGVGSTTGWQRGIYALLIGALFLMVWQQLDSWGQQARGKAVRPVYAFVACSLVAFSSIAAVERNSPSPRNPSGVDTAYTPIAGLPNIILFNTDGLEANHMSAYGYRRQTTPTIERLAEESLVFENAFHNGGHTSASISATLTGKFALTTGVLASGQMLSGGDAYEHLPGILRRLGYRSIYVGMRSYGDPFNLNMLDGFDSANDRSLIGTTTLPEDLRPLMVRYSAEVYFLAQIYWRAADRLLHAYAVTDMRNPFLEVKKRKRKWTDYQRVASILEYIESVPGPFFVHAHLMATHPPLEPFVRVFSKPGSRNTEDLYDDTVVQFDRFVRQLLDKLRETAQLDNTLLIITSDHGRNWSLNRIPLIIRFPGGEPRGRVETNAQLIDLPPTVLDYLGVPTPQWMEGNSLLAEDLDEERPIYGMTVGGRGSEAELRTVSVLVRDQVYELDVESRKLRLTRISEHTAPRNTMDRDSAPRMKQMLLELLGRSGFDHVDSESPEPPDADERQDRDAG